MKLVEASVAGFGVRLTGLRVLVLILDQVLGSSLQTLVAMARRQWQRIDQRIRRGPDLAQSDLRFFPPATAAFGGPGTNGSLG